MIVKAAIGQHVPNKEWVEENTEYLLERKWPYVPASSLPGGPGPAWWGSGHIMFMPEFTNAQHVQWASLWGMTPVELDIDEQILKVILRVPERSPR